MVLSFFCFKQKTAYDMRISDWSSDVCSSDLSYLLEPIGLSSVQRQGPASRAHHPMVASLSKGKRRVHPSTKSCYRRQRRCSLYLGGGKSPGRPERFPPG